MKIATVLLLLSQMAFAHSIIIEHLEDSSCRLSNGNDWMTPDDAQEQADAQALFGSKSHIICKPSQYGEWTAYLILANTTTTLHPHKEITPGHEIQDHRYSGRVLFRAGRARANHNHPVSKRRNRRISYRSRL